MSINEVVRIVRERYRVVLLCTLLGLLGAAAAVALIPREYASDVPLYVSLVGRVETSDQAYQANQLAKARVASYAPLMRDERITQAVINRLQLPMTAEQLAKHITVTVAPDAIVMVETVTDTSPQRAAAIANAAAEEFVGLVTQLEQPIGPAPAPAPALGAARQPTPEPTQIRPRIIRQATPSLIPVSPNVPFSVALGAALGLLIGLGAAFVRNARDTSVRDPERLQVLTSAAVLATIPADRAAGNSPITLDQSPESARAEAYRTLRTNLRFHHHGAPWNTGAKVVVVTSAGIGEGKSVTACNLARALATGSRVILIDANLRHPQVETYLGLEPGPGLTTVLAGNLGWPFARRRLNDVALEVLSSGPVGPRLGELLIWHRMDELLQELRRCYDFVIIDSPALLPVSDAAAVAARADGVILVVRYGATTEEQVAAAVEALRAVSAPVLGTALNMAPAPNPRRGRVNTYAEPPPPHLLPLPLVNPVSPANPASPAIPASPVSPLVPPDRRIPVEPAGNVGGDPPDGVDGSGPDGAAR
ncbi:MAG: polysaccharide biosynthesis tyrosine autokinase [Actinomycetota bacterium]|nr:polysaccharide biosynthesis tyrosine autokinase [Actinomycetota bacterium]